MSMQVPPMPDNAASLPPQILWGEGYVAGFEAATAIANAHLAAALRKLPESIVDDVVDALVATKERN